ncbi:MAG: hypothetical protein ACHQ1H_00475 [Nitrososphaerales archaeon]
MSTITKSSTTRSRLPRGVITDRIYRVLLSQPDGTLSGYKISKLADAHPYQVSLFLHQLTDSHYAKGTRVTNYKALLHEWAKLRITTHSQTYVLTNEMEIINSANLPYALTTFRAETLVNHYLFPSKTELYVRTQDVGRWHDYFVQKHALVGGGNVKIKWYDDQVLFNSFEIEGNKIVSIPQLITDLLREGSVATQAAEMMMNNWKKFQELNHKYRI